MYHQIFICIFIIRAARNQNINAIVIQPSAIMKLQNFDRILRQKCDWSIIKYCSAAEMSWSANCDLQIGEIMFVTSTILSVKTF